MNKFCVLSVALLVAATANAAEDFDGSRPMDCKPLQTHDCLPTEKVCTPLKPEAGKDETLHVDVANDVRQDPIQNRYASHRIVRVQQGVPRDAGHERRGRLECNHSSYERKTDHRDSGSRGRQHHFWPVRAFRCRSASDLTTEALDKGYRSGERGRAACFAEPIDECAERAMIFGCCGRVLAEFRERQQLRP